MKFTAVLTILIVAVATAVGAVPSVETNALRLARGLPPLPPGKRATPVSPAKRSHPSGTHGHCNTGSSLCCNHVTQAGDSAVNPILGLLGIHIPSNVVIGLTCSTLATDSSGHSDCDYQPVCCSDNHFNGVVAVGCSPINI